MFFVIRKNNNIFRALFSVSHSDFHNFKHISLTFIAQTPVKGPYYCKKQLVLLSETPESNYYKINLFKKVSFKN